MYECSDNWVRNSGCDYENGFGEGIVGYYSTGLKTCVDLSNGNGTPDFMWTSYPLVGSDHDYSCAPGFVCEFNGDGTINWCFPGLGAPPTCGGCTMGPNYGVDELHSNWCCANNGIGWFRGPVYYGDYCP